MHCQDGGVLPTQVVSSIEVTEELQDFIFDGDKLCFRFKLVQCSLLLVVYNISYTNYMIRVYGSELQFPLNQFLCSLVLVYNINHKHYD